MQENLRKYFQKDMIPRDVQTNAMAWVDDNWSLYRTLALSLSCGAGKSAIAMAIAKKIESFGGTCCICTPQKQLQQQLAKDYTHINLLKGAENYPCLEFPKETADVASALDYCKRCDKKNRCPYLVAKRRAYDENITIFNPMSYLFLKKSRTKNGITEILYEADTIILDECQAVSSMLSGAFDFKVWRFEHTYKKGISSSVPALIESLKVYGETLTGLFNSDLKVDERLKIQKIIYKLDMVIQGLKKDPSKFVVEETEELYRKVKADCLKVRVTAPPAWVLKWFFGEAKHIILMSGTLFRNTPKELGFTNYGYLDLPSPIPPAQRQFISLGCIKNSHGNTNAVVEMGQAILKIAKKHSGQRGIVLASYEQAKQLKGYLSDNKRFKFHDKTDKAEVVNSFMSGTGEDTIAVLSGSWEGLDAKDDLCRFIIITKCLFPNLGDAVVKRKMDLDPEWYGLETMKTIIQGANRATRHEKDFSVIYMLDSNFSRLYVRTKKHLPQYFIESIKWGKTLETI